MTSLYDIHATYEIPNVDTLAYDKQETTIKFIDEGGGAKTVTMVLNNVSYTVNRANLEEMFLFFFDKFDLHRNAAQKKAKKG